MSDCSHEWYETATLGVACLNCNEKHDDIELLLNTKEDRISEVVAERDQLKAKLNAFESVTDTECRDLLVEQKRRISELNGLLTLMKADNDRLQTRISELENRIIAANMLLPEMPESAKKALEGEQE